MVNEKYGTNLQESDITQWEVGGTEYGDKLQEFFQDPEFYKHQIPYDGSQEFVRKLSRKMEIFIVTAVPANVISTRIAQIKKYFPQIEIENIIPASRKDVINVDFALDDRSHNILTSNAKYPVLFRRPWNQNITGVLSVQSYDEFLNIIDCVKTSYAEPFIGFSRPTVLALVGPSGSGKTTILDELIKNEKIDKPVSATTRKRRNENEKYHFVSKDEFEQMNKNQQFAETTMYAGENYGVELNSISQILKEGKHCCVAVDISGALALKMQYRTAIFYINRDRKQLLTSLTDRLLNKEISSEDLVNRICSLDDENKNMDLCDFIVNNSNTVENAVEEFYKIYVFFKEGEEEEKDIEHMTHKLIRYGDGCVLYEPMEKALGIRNMLEHFGMKPNQAVVFGDGYNDLSMFRPEWLNIAMGNARPELKAKADYITTDCDKDGIYNACKHFGWID